MKPAMKKFLIVIGLMFLGFCFAFYISETKMSETKSLTYGGFIGGPIFLLLGNMMIVNTNFFVKSKAEALNGIWELLKKGEILITKLVGVAMSLIGILLIFQSIYGLIFGKLIF